jgi:hypothetical protein
VIVETVQVSVETQQVKIEERQVSVEAVSATKNIDILLKSHIYTVEHIELSGIQCLIY